MELSCERRAAATVAASAAYQSLCATLERARLDADAKMRSGRRASGELISIVRKSAALEQQSARVLEQVRGSVQTLLTVLVLNAGCSSAGCVQRRKAERGALDKVAAELAAYERAREAALQREQEARKREEEVRRREEEAREQVRLLWRLLSCDGTAVLT